MKKIEFFLLLIILGAFIVRLYKFNNPIGDWHSWRQADTSAVSRNFIKFGFDILHPRFDDLSKTPSGGIDNPQGYRFVEFPIYNIAQAGLYKFFGYFTIEQWGRIVTILSSILSIIFVFLIVKKYINASAGIFAAFFLAFLPYNIYYSRTILPDPLASMGILGGIYFFDKWIERPKFSIFNFQFLLALVFTSGALLAKPFVVFFALPFIYLVLSKFGLSFFKKWQLWFFLIFISSPLIFWRIWIQQYPGAIPMSSWLFNGNHIRFKGAFFQWIFAQRIPNLILGYWGLPIVILGIISKIKNRDLFLFSFLLSSLLYLFTVATGNVQHDYYQILIIPTLAIFFARGIDFLIRHSNDLLNKKITYLFIVLSTAFMLMFGWYSVRDYYNINHPEVIKAGRIIDKVLPKDAKVIAVYGGDTTFLYYVNRQGWPVFDRQIEDFIKSGAGYVAFINPGKEELDFANHFQTTAKDPHYAVYDLNKPLNISKK